MIVIVIVAILRDLLNHSKVLLFVGKRNYRHSSVFVRPPALIPPGNRAYDFQFISHDQNWKLLETVNLLKTIYNEVNQSPQLHLPLVFFLLRDTFDAIAQK